MARNTVKNASTTVENNAPELLPDASQAPRSTQETALVTSKSAAVAQLLNEMATDISSGGFVGKMTPELNDALLADTTIEWSPVFITLEPGDVIRGYLVGKGVTEVEDQQTRQPKPVPTWIMADKLGEGARHAQFLTSHQLESDLVRINPTTGEVEPRFNELVMIARLPDERSAKGRVVSRYRIAWLGAKKGEVK